MTLPAAVTLLASLAGNPDAALAVQTDPTTPAATAEATTPAGQADPVKAPPVDPTAPVLPPPGTPMEPAVPNEIVVTGRGKPPKSDPLQAVNAQTFEVMSAVDGAIVAPIAYGYRSVIPEPVKDGLHNMLINLTEPIVFVNDILQLKIGRAMKTLARFVINSTVGVLGLFDVAKKKPFKIDYHVNGFAYTLGYWGIKPGPFLFLPLIGPTTVRDVIGRVLDLSLLPGVVGKPFSDPKYALASGALKSIDERLERDDMLMVIKEDCPDSYAAERAWYLAKRQAVIDQLRNRPVDVKAQMPVCLVDGLKKRAADRAKLLPAGAAQPDLEADLTPRS
ncbi:phospholipid-binding lipoprotein MlaA [Novosphingobium kunmingense]|uniref:Phospholipid-binding lipoprotein MlaA n=1 Tax=Novosphingobium kunmingense TaxID=1211806 RepID=A0A2N0H6S3_9SPHN|nr:VacJ family lipoprotein [Novosphingobium kunmingense]PKB14627.1 phospholipid-binding lipoprotein MlaA [Novosphingobium kunmingense]